MAAIQRLKAKVCCEESDDEEGTSELEGEQEGRTVPFGTLFEDIGSKFANKLITSKYTPITFLPKTLYEQVTKFTNAYFIMLIILMLLGTPNTDWYVSPSTAFGTAITLFFLMLISVCVAAYDDIKRHRADREINERTAYIFDGDKFEHEKWEDVQVGDILMVRSDTEIPADLAVFASSGSQGEDGKAFVSTMNLDGETNLKQKFAPQPCQQRLVAPGGNSSPEAAARALSSWAGYIEASAPVKETNVFSGAIHVQGQSDPISLGMENFLLRGTQLQITQWVVGIVLFTGEDTKIRLNARPAAYKRSTIERYINMSVLVVFVVQVLLSLVSAIIFAAQESSFEDLWYIYPGNSGPEDFFTWPSVLAFFLTFFILYANLMPIAILASMEAVNLMHKWYIEEDEMMYDRDLKKKAKVRTANLCQEIGQISYIFSDKTGTLTKNILELRQVSIAGKTYGSKEAPEPGFQGVEEVNRDKSEATDKFWETIATCHTVFLTVDEQGNKKYQAESPDEAALVEGARKVGWDFENKKKEKTYERMYLQTPKGPQEYEVLAVNEFSSGRARSSMLLKDKSGQHVLVAKGSDKVMLEIARSGKETVTQALDTFASDGLRVLVVARRGIDGGEASNFLSEYNTAKNSIHNRKEKLEAAAAKIERDLEIVGVTGVEDKLQDNLQDTIVSIRRAGIHLWVLTGDKLETAENIGFNAKLLEDGMHIIRYKTGGPSLREDLKKSIRQAKEANSAKQSVALIIRGEVLTHITDDPLKKVLLKLTEECAVVIACQVDPDQKAQLVEMVRKDKASQPVCLAIGDGANDVSMIQAAQVGVGILGREGSQAVNAADFAITQFQFLQRLLLIHGRWNYRRAAKLIVYTYWKSVLVTYILFYYGFYCGFSGTAAFTGILWLSYSWWTSVGITVVAVMDRDLEQDMCLKHPSLYDFGSQRLEFNFLKVVEMLISSFIHSLIIFFILVLAVPSFESLGRGGFVTWGTAIYTGLIVNVTWRLMFITTTWNWVVALAVFLPFLCFIIFLVIYSAYQWYIPAFDVWWMNFYFVGFQMVNQWMFWILIVTLPLLAGTLDTFREFLIGQFLPDRRDVYLEEARLENPNLEPFEEEIYKEALPCDRPGQGLPAFQGGYLPGYPYAGGPHPYAGGPHPYAGPPHPYAGGPRQVWAPPVRNGYVMAHPPAAGYAQAVPHPHVGARWAASPAGPPMAYTGAPGARGSAFGMYMFRWWQDESDEEEEEDEEYETEQKEEKPNESPFWQQDLPSYQSVPRWQTSLCCACSSTIILTIFGILVLVSSLSVDLFVVQYNGKERRPFGVSSDSFVHNKCEPAAFGNTTTCCFNYTAPVDLSGPVEVFYVLDHYYQNHIFYQQSNLWREQQGEAWYPGDRDTLREDRCKPKESRLDSDGNKLYPCGLHTLSFFNDTYTFPGRELLTDSIAWPTDEDLISNPDFYPDGDYQFVNERFPGVISEAEGVENPHYIVWIRLASLDYVYKRYGTLDMDINKGELLQLCINASYPLEEKKYVVLSEVTPLGGKNDLLGIALLVCAGIALWAAFFMASVLICCRRELGQKPFLGTRERFFKQAHEQSIREMCGCDATEEDSDDVE